MEDKQLRKWGGGAFLVVILVVFAFARRAEWFSQLWSKSHEGQALSRNEADKERELRELGEVGGFDLHCKDIVTHYEFTSVYVEGCGKHVDYVRVGDQWQKKGDVTTIVAARATSDNPSGCIVLWSAEDAPSPTAARDTAKEIFAKKHTARVRVPTTATGVHGLDVIVIGPTYDQFIDPDAGESAFATDAMTIACTIDAGGARCTVPWTAAIEVSDCQ